MAALPPHAFQVTGPARPPLDMYLDPETLDYVRLDDGTWLEVASAQTAIMAQLSIRLGSCFIRPQDGTRIGALLDTGQPITPLTLEAETSRGLAGLAAAGILGANFDVSARDRDGNQLYDERGRAAVETSAFDLSSSSPVNVVLTPLR